MKAYWQQETLYFDAENYFQTLLQDIEQATNSLILETYIFSKDGIGEKVIEALVAAAKRGVSIRVLMDGIGSSEDGEYITTLLTQAGIDARIFRPLPWHFSLHHRGLLQGKWHEKISNFIWRINKRNHRKLCIIDHQIAWIGSFNITQDHFGQDGNSWKDLAARVRGENVKKLQQNFDQLWRRTNSQRRYPQLRGFFSNNSILLRKKKNSNLIRLIQKAKTRVWITNAYFSPSFKFLRALKQAHAIGISVQIIVPEKSDHFFFPALSSTYYADLLKAGVRIFEYQAGVLHEKSMLIDNYAIVGSTNLNYRSFFHDLELDVLLNQPETIRKIENNFNKSLMNSREITAPYLLRYPLLLRLIGWLSRFFRYWL